MTHTVCVPRSRQAEATPHHKKSTRNLRQNPFAQCAPSPAVNAMTRQDFCWARQQCWLLFCASICLQLPVHSHGKKDAAPDLARIVGGSHSDVGRHPYYASLYETSIQASDFRCGGSLVAPDVILSAAHCVTGGFQIKNVVVNNTNVKGDNPYGYRRQVIRTMVHPSWNPSSLRNDLALLLLNEAVDDVEPASYSRQFPVLSILDTLTILGLGATEDGGSFPDSLQEVDVEITPFDFCDDAYSSNGIFDFLTGLTESTQFCASSPGQDACQGDSGGPMVVSSSTVKDLQIGLISFGLGCARPDFPGTRHDDDTSVCLSMRESRFVPIPHCPGLLFFLRNVQVCTQS